MVEAQNTSRVAYLLLFLGGFLGALLWNIFSPFDDNEFVLDLVGTFLAVLMVAFASQFVLKLVRTKRPPAP